MHSNDTGPSADEPCQDLVHSPERLAALRRFRILDTDVEPAFDDLAKLAAHICQAPIAVINFIDAQRQWFKSEIGLGVRQTPLNISICRHALLSRDVFVVPDTRLDSRFVCNPLVSGENGLRFYAGALLRTDDNQALGTLCVLDHQPRTLSAAQLELLQALARQVMVLLELRRLNSAQADTIAQLEDIRGQLSRQALTDPLTGLANRRAFIGQLGKALARAADTDEPCAIVMMDLDYFKLINDTYGHQVGDDVLRHFATICQRVLRATDVICRWGGEEFIALLTHTTLGQARLATQRVHDALRQTPFSTQGQPIELTVSMGLIPLSGETDLQAVLKRLDHALYRAKESGRNRTILG